MEKMKRWGMEKMEKRKRGEEEEDRREEEEDRRE
jgi:hypothetical protein